MSLSGPKESQPPSEPKPTFKPAAIQTQTAMVPSGSAVPENQRLPNRAPSGQPSGHGDSSADAGSIPDSSLPLTLSPSEAPERGPAFPSCRIPHRKAEAPCQSLAGSKLSATSFRPPGHPESAWIQNSPPWRRRNHPIPGAANLAGG